MIACCLQDTHELLSDAREVLGQKPIAHIRAKELHVNPERTICLDAKLLHLRLSESKLANVELLLGRF